MKIFDWRKNAWYHRALLALTIISVIVLASHPELRLLLPLIDAMGLDLLLFLIGSQCLAYASPLLHFLHRQVFLPLANRLYFLFIYLLGISGPFVDARVTGNRLSRVPVA